MEYSALAGDDLLVKIVVSLDSGNYPAKVARILGSSRQKVDYWIKKAAKNGFLELESRGVVTHYRLTQLVELCVKETSQGVRELCEWMPSR